MVRISTVVLVALGLAGCQASMREEPVEPVATAPAVEDQQTAEAAQPNFTPQAYAGATDLDALTAMRWDVSEGDGTPSGTCTLSFSSPQSEQSQVLRTLGAGVYGGKLTSSGCQNEDLAQASYWSISGSSIELHGDETQTTAYLLMERPDLLLGYTAQGADLVLSHALAQ